MPVPSPDKWGGLQQERHPVQNIFARLYKCIMLINPYRSVKARITNDRPGVARQGTCGNYATAGLSENKRKMRGEKASEKAAGTVKKRCRLIKFGILNIGTMTGRGRELADMMK